MIQSTKHGCTVRIVNPSASPSANQSVSLRNYKLPCFDRFRKPDTGLGNLPCIVRVPAEPTESLLSPGRPVRSFHRQRPRDSNPLTATRAVLLRATRPL